jgi:hypothetical protein
MGLPSSPAGARREGAKTGEGKPEPHQHRAAGQSEPGRTVLRDRIEGLLAEHVHDETADPGHSHVANPVHHDIPGEEKKVRLRRDGDGNDRQHGGDDRARCERDLP